MKKIKIKICNYDQNDKCSYGHYLVTTLSKDYDVELSDNPDYLFYNESAYEHLNYNCIKIFYTGENLTPNFNLCDYAIGFDYMSFGDRYYRLPLYLLATFYNEKEIAQAGDGDFSKQINFTKSDLAKKTEFCSFVYSNYLGDSARKDFFNKLSAYKKVDAGGAYLNNTGKKLENKLEFELAHKFSIAFENSSRDGYTTEKLPTALLAKTIPIYWGNPRIGEEFNDSRFINCHKYKDFDAVVEKIKQIDADDDLYLEIINQPVKTAYDFNKINEGFRTFLRNIIDQPIKNVSRKSINPMRSLEIERNEKVVAQFVGRQASTKRILARLYKPFKKLMFLEKFKEKYFANKIFKK